MTGGERTKVAIIGGGPSGLAAAFELTADGRDGEYDVTIFQQGWLLGGKCASGRNPDKGFGGRIEEHGLHIWFGCYENVRSILDRCYDELAEPPYPSVDDALQGVDTIVLGQRINDEWEFNKLVFPHDRTPPLNFADFVSSALAWVAHGLVKHRRRADQDTDAGLGWDDVRPVLQAVRVPEPDDGKWLDGIQHAASHLSRDLTAIYLDLRHAMLDPIERLEHFTQLVEATLPEREGEPAEVTFYRDAVRILFAVLRGVSEDHLLDRGFSAINDWDLADWLGEHGLDLPDDPLEWPTLLRAVYDGCFAFLDGDPSTPRMAAGRAIQGAVRCAFHYGGSVLFRPQGSMSDVVIAPVAQRLAQRKVKIRYFHAVRQLHLSPDKQRIAEIEVVRQLPEDVIDQVHQLVYEDGDDAAPKWPSKLPDDFGIPSSVRLTQEIDPLGGEVVRFSDFDRVILAVPPDVQREICDELVAADPKYASMLENATSVATQAGQLWLSETAATLGQKFPEDSLLSCFVEALDTYADMAHLTSHEGWTEADDVKHIAYFCGVLPHTDITDQKAADATARDEFTAFLNDHVHEIWPGSVTQGTEVFDPQLLVPRTADPLANQYTRANWAPTERYVLTLPDSVQYRLHASETPFENLTLAGDWTKNGFDAGCLEAAVTSGRLASQAICGYPLPDDIPGVNGPPGFPSEGTRGGNDVLDEAARVARLALSTGKGALRLLRVAVNALPLPGR